jgi:signal peptidase II
VRPCLPRARRAPTAKRHSETSLELTGSDKTKWILAASTAAAALALDLLSKRIVQSTMVLGQPGIPGDEYRLLPFLTLQRASNQGVAFGLLSGRYSVIVPAACLALVLIFVYLALEPRPIIAGLAGGMLIGGSMGNLLERLTRGHVTDFLRLPHWPTFNLADIFILVGVALVAISLLWGGTESRTVEGAPNG